LANFLIIYCRIVLWFANVIFSRECYIFFRIFCRRLWIILFFLIYYICNLFLRAFKESINLTLSMLFYWIVPPLNPWRIDRSMSCRALVSFHSSRNYYSRLRSRRSWTWSSYFSLIPFLCLLHVFALDYVILNIFLFLSSSSLLISIYNNVKFIKLVKTLRFISSSIVMITFSSPFSLLWIY
jgi:hypothetical protein